MTSTPQDGRDGPDPAETAGSGAGAGPASGADDAARSGARGGAAQSGAAQGDAAQGGADAADGGAGRDSSARAGGEGAASDADAAPDAAAADAAPEENAGDAVDARVAELTGDLQRLQAEYANYRKREQRERQVAIAKAKASVIGELLDLLDDLDRAREHGDLESGPLKAIADKFVSTLSGLGLEGFGRAGEPFDPEQHEAVQHAGEGDVPVLDTVLRRGYKVGERVLRTAMVIVGDGPAEESAPQSGGTDQAQPGQGASAETGSAGSGGTAG